MMKKLLYILSLVAVCFTACDPTESVYDELDKGKEPYNKHIEVDIVESDYLDLSNLYKAEYRTKEDTILADKVKDNKHFSASVPADKFISLYLAANYLALDEKSSAVVTFDYDEGETEVQQKYEAAKDYELSEDDYAFVGDKVAEFNFFMPSFPAEEYLPAVLANTIVNPVEDDLRLVTYKYVNEDPKGGATEDIFDEQFEDVVAKEPVALEGWLNLMTKGDRQWEGRSFSDNGYCQASAFKATEDIEMMLVSPVIDLTGKSNVQFSFDVNVGHYNHTSTPLKVMVSTNLDGDKVADADWTDITDQFTVPTEPTDTYGTMGSAGVADLNFSEEINIAFVYTGNATETSTIQVDKVKVFSGVETESNTAYSYYAFDGSTWEKQVEDIRIIQPFEYDEMGSPGKYDNFSSSDKPEDYIPNFLIKNYPYALVDDVKNIAYRYYSGGTHVRIDSYIRTASTWTKLESVVKRTEQYVHNGSGWFFDPTVRFTMASDDYQMIVDKVKVSHPELIDRGNSEYYYGSSAWYSNFDMRNTKRTSGDFAQAEFEGKSSEEIQEVIAQRVQEGIVLMLQTKFPDAVAQVNGIDVNYIVTYKVYDNELKKLFYTVTYQCTAAGSPATFKLIEGPVKVE